MSQASFTPALGHDWVISRLDDPSYVGYGVFDYVHYCRRCELRIYVNSAAPSSYYGDVDNNGKIEVSDALMALQAYVKTRTLTDDQFTRADIDADGSHHGHRRIVYTAVFGGTKSLIPRRPNVIQKPT